MRIEIGKNIKQAITEWLILDFSTTTKIESLLSYKAIMDTVQKYFEYECYTIRYTIRNVHLMRRLEASTLKTEELKKFTISSSDIMK